MMKMLSVVLALCMVLSVSTFAHAETMEYETDVYEENLRLYTANDRKEESILNACLRPNSWVDNENPSIVSKAAEITKDITEPYEKAKAIHDWMCENVGYYAVSRYIPEGFVITTAVGILRDMRGDAGGWAILSVALLNAAGIPAKRVFGWMLLPDGSEADLSWCEAFVDNRWVIIAAVHDTGNIIYDEGKDAVITRDGHVSDEFFDISIQALSKRHKIELYDPSFERRIEDGVLVKCGDDGSDIVGITKIDNSAFSNNLLLTEFDIPDGVTYVGNFAFSNCRSLTRVSFPDSVAVLGYEAFYGATGLVSVDLPPRITEIQMATFWGAHSLKEIILPRDLKYIDRNAFMECFALERVHIPNGVEEIAMYAFVNCIRLKEVYIPPSVRIIGINAFGMRGAGQNPVFTKVPDFTIVGVSGTAAEEYAQSNGFSFRSITLSATPTDSNCVLNGKNVVFDAYNIEDSNYFKLRDLAYVLNGTEKQFEVEWDGGYQAITLTSGKPYTAIGGEMMAKGEGVKTPKYSNSRIYLDGEEIFLTAYNIDGNNYFRLRDVGEVFDFNVSWDGANNAIVIATEVKYMTD